MNKVLIIHGFEGAPNEGWRPWLMSELNKMNVYSCALPMPSPERPVLSEWIGEIARQVLAGKCDDFYLVGHSLGVPAILHFLESMPVEIHIAGAVLVSGPIEDIGMEEITGFLAAPFDFETIRRRVTDVAIIQGDDDPYVPLAHAECLSKKLAGELTIIPGGGHLNGSGGWTSLPQALEALKKMLV